ncbi:sulfonate ABC transporter substrate-binding protein [Nostoc sp. FACHB-87]|uniref:sulfonate ABC transporter substrate-binding protein n=1 Tax=Nostocales TaxID=1161 RepID=UPI001681F805|nr:MULTISPECIES: sulfonate ABC transporter substrate-binding protein [Nostocales]MBD2297117.1 sulfonate ABC transporter substrate-binding protein [Nostoc sp. FACHB-190]MBD2454900.1 sulfonate ABC transporter substrate-binding protein [Nostoc sp. FACHB-87]MBD2474779.1 sulfonate ABC transporter substrate-binding protein [Anabaena sp. FACHB-83]MBD2488121.1 sulfonate ABC transporter substrate-binding protein [Aulosira sp. FACHB-615]
MTSLIFRYLIDRWRSLIQFLNLSLQKSPRLRFHTTPLPIAGAFITGLCLSLLFAACSSPSNVSTPNASANPVSNSAPQEAKVIRFGYQKSLILLKTKGVLEKRFAPEGKSVEWIEFPAGPQLLEAMNVGSIDFGHVGESPPIFAQAAGAALTYVAGIAPSPAGSAILVPENSPIKQLSDLKGKKIAFQKGSSAHLLLVQALEKGGVKYSEIEPKYLPPADARAAFVKGSIDAWVIWDPFYAAAQKATNARVLVDGTGINKQGGYYIGSRKFVTENPQSVKAILEEIQKLEEWSAQNRDEVAQTLAPVLGIDLETMKKATSRRSFGVVPIDDNLINLQQGVADTYYQLKLIPKEVKVRDALLTKEQYAAFSPKT